MKSYYKNQNVNYSKKYTLGNNTAALPATVKEVVEILVSSGITKKEIAKRIKVPAATITHITSGKEASLSVFDKLICFYFYYQIFARKH